MKQWEKFEQDALEYVQYLFSDDFAIILESGITDRNVQRDYQNLEFIRNICNVNGADPYTMSFVLAGGSDWRYSDIKMEPSGLFIESKMKSAQCGQMIVEQDAFGNFQLATHYTGEIAPWDNNDEGENDEEVDEGREYFAFEDQWYFQDVKDNFIACMNESVKGDTNDDDAFDGDAGTPWKATKFMYNHFATYETIFAHYESKGAQLFVTKTQNSTYDDPTGWLIFPIDYLDNYFDVWATYRHKKSGSKRVANIHLPDAEHALGIKQQAYQHKAYGWCVDLPVEAGYDDRHTVQGVSNWYKLLAKESCSNGNICYQIRQLGNACQPTVVLKLKVKPQAELPEWHR